MHDSSKIFRTQTCTTYQIMLYRLFPPPNLCPNLNHILKSHTIFLNRHGDETTAVQTWPQSDFHMKSNFLQSLRLHSHNWVLTMAADSDSDDEDDDQYLSQQSSADKESLLELETASKKRQKCAFAA